MNEQQKLQEENIDSAHRLSVFILQQYPSLMFGIEIRSEDFFVNINKPFEPLQNPPLIWEGHQVKYM
jgi:hypothetical protein